MSFGTLTNNRSESEISQLFARSRNRKIMTVSSEFESRIRTTATNTTAARRYPQKVAKYIKDEKPYPKC